VPDSAVAGKRFSSMTGSPKGKVLLAPVEPFRQHGQSGAWVSAFLPHTAGIADELCFIKGMHTDAVNHAPAISLLLSGGQIPSRPTLGAWLAYGLGNDTENLPAFVVMTSVSKGTTCGQIFYDFYWSAGFLPSRFQGVKFRGGGDPVLYLANPAGVSREMRRGLLDDIAKLNELKLREFGDPEIATRIAQYEMPSRCRPACRTMTDLSKEPARVLDMYGPQAREPGTFAHNCVMARRLVERGVRCVQVMHAGWDQHRSLTTELYTQCRDNRPAVGGAGEGFESSRPAGRDVGDLGRRVRPDAIYPGRTGRAQELGPRPSPVCVHQLGGRRRYQAGIVVWRFR